MHACESFRSAGLRFRCLLLDMAGRITALRHIDIAVVTLCGCPKRTVASKTSMSMSMTLTETTLQHGAGIEVVVLPVSLVTNESFQLHGGLNMLAAFSSASTSAMSVCLPENGPESDAALPFLSRCDFVRCSMYCRRSSFNSSLAVSVVS